MASDDRKFIQVSTDTSTFQALLRISTTLGTHPSDLGARFIEQGIAQAIKSANNPLLEQDDPELRIWRVFYETRKKSQTRSQLRQIARYIISSGQDEAAMDEFSDLCEGVGVTPQEIYQEAQNEEQISGGFIELDTGPINDARSFLMEILGSGKEIPTVQLQFMANKRHISQSALKAARQQLKVVSSNAGGHWTVRLPLSMQVPPSIDVRR